jgi:hypothetical protein
MSDGPLLPVHFASLGAWPGVVHEFGDGCRVRTVVVSVSTGSESLTTTAQKVF